MDSCRAPDAARIIPLFTLILCSRMITHIRCKPHRFDFYYFVQQWPGSYCDTASKCCFPTSGSPPPDFGIHGLWPNYNSGHHPSNCDPHKKFRPQELSDLQWELSKYWGSLACPGGNNHKFLAHEWQKHGTCSSFRSEHGYFEAALNLRTHIDLLEALQSAGIEPNGDSYAVSSITEALDEYLGHTPAIDCNKDKGKHDQLYQVYICVNKDGSTLIDCPVMPQSSCPSHVKFPSFDPDNYMHLSQDLNNNASQTQDIDVEIGSIVAVL